MKTLLAVLAISALMAVSAMALGDDVLKVSIPFDFIAAGKHMPAGDYFVVRGSAPAGITVRPKAGGDSVFVMYHPGEANRTGFDHAVSFSNYGGTYFLKEVWVGQESNGMKMPATKAEKEMLSRTPVKTTIAASLAR